MKGRILAGKILVKLFDKETKTKSGIIIPDSVETGNKHSWGEVVLTGGDSPKYKMVVSKGDKILFKQSITEKFEYSDEELYLLNIQDVLLIQ